MLKNLSLFSILIFSIPVYSAEEKVRKEQQESTIANEMEQQILKNLEIGNAYFFGNGVSKDYQKAAKYYEPISEQNMNLVAKAKANFRIGEIYYFGGLGIKRNYMTARRYYLNVINQKVDLILKNFADLRLATIYCEGRDAGLNL